MYNLVRLPGLNNNNFTVFQSLPSKCVKSSTKCLNNWKKLSFTSTFSWPHCWQNLPATSIPQLRQSLDDLSFKCDILDAKINNLGDCRFTSGLPFFAMLKTSSSCIGLTQSLSSNCLANTWLFSFSSTYTSELVTQPQIKKASHFRERLRASGGNRTRTRVAANRILSPACLPVPPPRRLLQT